MATTTILDVVVSHSDAEALALMLGERRRGHTLEAQSADALAGIMMEARLVDEADLPDDRVAMNSLVAYEDETGRSRRRVTLAFPIDADPAAGRVSVLSPVGLALLGRKAGSVSEAEMPDGRVQQLRILSIQRPLRKAA